MSRIIVVSFALFLFGCATAERIVPAPVVLPDDGALSSFGELHPKLRQLAWRATEAFYRDDWKELSETAQSLNKAAGLLKTTKDIPARLQADLPAKCTTLATESEQLRVAAQAPAPDEISAHLQKIHNLIRELRPDA